jgi:2-oxoacid:acceptor oxidoreductase delta subunit (pyruvate/2-ketoisovalerate family)
MVNRSCVREKRPRGSSDRVIEIDFNRHDVPMTPKEAQYEASRCLGNISCEACDVCRFLCPDLAITRDSVTGEINIDLEYCKGCGICAAVCPKGAIAMVLEE